MILLEYGYDPLRGGCYAFSPTLRAIAESSGGCGTVVQPVE